MFPKKELASFSICKFWNNWMNFSMHSLAKHFLSIYLELYRSFFSSLVLDGWTFRFNFLVIWTPSLACHMFVYFVLILLLYRLIEANNIGIYHGYFLLIKAISLSPLITVVTSKVYKASLLHKSAYAWANEFFRLCPSSSLFPPYL